LKKRRVPVTASWRRPSRKPGTASRSARVLVLKPFLEVRLPAGRDIVEDRENAGQCIGHVSVSVLAVAQRAPKKKSTMIGRLALCMSTAGHDPACLWPSQHAAAA